jgi:hypothetical protein
MNQATRSFAKFALSVFFLAVLASCGGGGGSSPSLLTSTAYQAGLTIGDNGNLCINTNTTAVLATSTCPALSAMSYSLTIKNSSYGLAGQTLTGTFTSNSDGSYQIVGSTYASIFVYPKYSILTLKIDPTNPIFSNYYSLNPHLTSATYIPIFALNSSSLLTSTDQITSNNVSFDYREASMGMSVSGGTTSYLSEVSHGTVTKVSSNVFTVASCSNNGNSANNGNLTSSNCTGGLINSQTFTYDSSSGSWLVTPVDPNHSSQIIRAYFVNDVMSNSVVGYIDTSDSTKTSSKFAYVAIVPVGTNEPNPGAGTATYTGYQLCSSDSNCASTNGSQGIYYTNSLPSSVISTGSVTTASTDWNAGCNVTNSDNYYSPGFTANFFTPGSGACTTAGYRPDTIGFSFGSQVSNGKQVSLLALVGYDSTVSPSQKITLGHIKMN